MNDLPLTNVQTRDIESILHPYTPLHKLPQSGPLVMSRGKGVYIYDTRGREYLEGMAGLWCAGLGFGDEEMIEAATEQMRTLPYYHLFGAKGMEPAIELAEALKELAPVPVSKVFFTSSGSEANDTQVKLAWYLNNALGRPEKKKIISRVKAYHGVTIMSGSLTGLPFAHDGFDLPVDRVLHADCPHHYRFGRDGETEDEFVKRLAGNLQTLIEREGPETIAAMIAEPVMGAGGVIVPPKGYFEAIRPILDEHDIMLVGDEVITGFGRTGNWWGCQTLGMRPTTISAAKQLTAAYAPLGAVMAPEDVYQAYVDHSATLGTFGHGYTYGGHPPVLRARRESNRNLQEAGHSRPCPQSHTGIFRTPAPAVGAPAGRRNEVLRSRGRRGTGGEQDRQAVVRSIPGRRTATLEVPGKPRGGITGNRRYDRHLPADDYLAGRA